MAVDGTSNKPKASARRHLPRRGKSHTSPVAIEEPWTAPAATGVPALRDGYAKGERVARWREPALATADDNQSLTWVRSHAEVFEHPPSPEDVDQGRVGDCFFMAPLASLAATHPEVIQRGITYAGTDRHGRRLFDVLFYVPHDEPGAIDRIRHFGRAGPDLTDSWTDKRGKRRQVAFTPVRVRVDDTLPVDADLYREKGEYVPRYASAHYSDSPRALWVSLYEKAYARLKGGYDVLDQGGMSGAAMRYLSPSHWERHTLLTEEPNAVFELLKKACAAGQLTTLETYDNGSKPDDGVRWALRRYNPRGPDGKPLFDAKHFRFTDMDMLPGDNGWTPDHAYTLLRAWVDPRGVKMVELRNPGGDTRPPDYTDGKRDGHAIVPWDVARALFQYGYVGGAKGT